MWEGVTMLIVKSIGSLSQEPLNERDAHILFFRVDGIKKELEPFL